MLGISPITVRPAARNTVSTGAPSFKGVDNNPEELKEKSAARHAIMIFPDIITHTCLDENDEVISYRAVATTEGSKKNVRNLFNALREKGEKVGVSLYERASVDLIELHKVEARYGKRSEEYKRAYKKFDAALTAKGKQNAGNDGANGDAKKNAVLADARTIVVMPERNAPQTVVQMPVQKAASPQIVKEAPVSNASEVDTPDLEDLELLCFKRPPSLKYMVTLNDKTIDANPTRVQKEYAERAANSLDFAHVRHGGLNRQAIEEANQILGNLEKNGHIKMGTTIVIETRNGYIIGYNAIAGDSDGRGPSIITSPGALIICDKNGSLLYGCSTPNRKTSEEVINLQDARNRREGVQPKRGTKKPETLLSLIRELFFPTSKA